MSGAIILLPILIPVCAGLLVFLFPRRLFVTKAVFSIGITVVNLVIALAVFNKQIVFQRGWAGFGIEVSLKLYHFSGMILLAAALFGVLLALYSYAFMRGKENLSQFYGYFLLTLGFTSGAVLSDNLVLMLFFWEGLLLMLFGMISIGGKAAFKTAVKAFTIVAVTDLCMMVGIALTGHLAGTLAISQINLSLNTQGCLAFMLLMTGAISKAGSMPFHSWIPDAALDAPLPFMALVPAAFEKLLGIYFLSRITLDMFQFNGASWLSPLLMVIGAATILLAVMMALAQKDYKRLLSYHAVSQVGYMILGIGTAVPAGIVGGLFHMINHAIYKCGLFLTGGAVEKQTGTTDLAKLGGLRTAMPVTFGCFLITAASISGVPPFNGFFSKELIYEASLERGVVFYCIAAMGSFFTAASFLKLGHAAFFGNPLQRRPGVKEAPWQMLAAMIALAAVCIFFGVYSAVPLGKFIQPIAGLKMHGHNFAGAPVNMKLALITLAVLAVAVINHVFGVVTMGSGLKALDYITHAPLLSRIYDMAEKKYFDPYALGCRLVALVAHAGWGVDRAIDWAYNSLIVRGSAGLSEAIRRLQNGSYVAYLGWSLAGMCAVLLMLMARGH